MDIHRGRIYLADLNPRGGTEPLNTRPVLVVQTDLLNAVGHPSTVVLPLTDRVVDDAEPLRVRLDPASGLGEPSDILIDQPRAIDNRRLHHAGSTPSNSVLGRASEATMRNVERCLAILFDLPGATLP